MDYWDFIAHSQKGAERDGHKYYARVQTGTNKLGFPQYRYFYDAREYGAYMTSQKSGGATPQTKETKGYTTYVTGRGKQMLPSNIAKSDIDRMRRSNTATTHTMTTKPNGEGEKVGASAVNRVKTVHDYKKPLRKAKEKISGLQRDAAKSHRDNRWHETGFIGNGNSNTVTSTNRYTGKTRTATYEGKVAAQKDNEYQRNHSQYGTTQKNRRLAKAERKRKALEAVYQTDKNLRRAKRKAQKAGMDAKRKGAAAVSKLLGHKNKKTASSGASSRAKRIGEQHSMDRKRWDTEARAAQVKKDAKAYRKKRREQTKQTIAGKKRIMDNVRERPYYQPSIKR